MEPERVEGLELDAEKLGLVVVDDLPDDADLAPAPNLPDQAAP